MARSKREKKYDETGINGYHCRIHCTFMATVAQCFF